MTPRNRVMSAGPSNSTLHSKNTQISGREVSALLPTLPENSKRNRNLSDAAVLRLVAEWDAQERRVRNREAKDMRRARAYSVMPEPPATSTSDDFVFAVPMVPNRHSRSTSIPNFVLRSSSMEPSFANGGSRKNSITTGTPSRESSVARESRKNSKINGTPSRESSVARESRKNSKTNGTPSRETSVARESRKNSGTTGTPSRETAGARGSLKNSGPTPTPSHETSVPRGSRKKSTSTGTPPRETSVTRGSRKNSVTTVTPSRETSVARGSRMDSGTEGIAKSSLRGSRLSSILRDDKARYNRALSVSFDIDHAETGDGSTESESPSGSKQHLGSAIPVSSVRQSRKSPGPGLSRFSPRLSAKRPHSPENGKSDAPAKRNNVRYCGHRSKMNQDRREQMKDSECIVDECPSCTVPLITNPLTRTIDIDDYEDRHNVSRPHINKRLCLAGLIANQLVYNDEGKLIRRTDLLGVITRRIRDKFDIEKDTEIPDNFFITGLEGIAFNENYLTPDIVLNPEHFTKATSDMPTRLKMMICSFPVWAKDMYFSMRRMYEQQIQAIINDRGINSTRFDLDIRPPRPSNVPCFCDKYNLRRCGDKNSKCCGPEMMEMIERCRNSEDSDSRE
ncbi:hypothetical protein PRIPAC_95945 [Pristionchus pacificus]|uniref:Uncharacterized protein n=1 Tax=Pristionchus pacificus TaxID=54126 RepID=A0A2A6D2M3_PRIPA|nr:hypothetical protein PRIPAC_95945 [Pristionchus pacificus]|eukprot:PDM84586.1 hypothetical protein PRIPAC_33609 [Pristionchus pacificus]